MGTIHLLEPVGGRELAGPAIGRFGPLLHSAPSPSPQSHLLLPSSSSLVPTPLHTPAEAQCRMVQGHQHPPGRPAGRGQRAPPATLLLR